MWRLGPHHHSLLRCYQFVDPMLEARYKETSVDVTVQFAPDRIHVHGFIFLGQKEHILVVWSNTYLRPLFSVLSCLLLLP